MATYEDGLRRRLLNEVNEGRHGATESARSVEAWAEALGDEDGSHNQPRPNDTQGAQAVRIMRGFLGKEQQAVADDWKRSVARLDATLADVSEKSNGHAAHSQQGDQDDEEIVAVQTHLSIWVYLVIAALIGAAEFVLMAVVFQIFGANTVETWIAAAGLGFILPITAHNIGAQFKTRDNPVTLWGALGALVLILGVLAVLRALFLTQSAVTARLVGREVSAGVWTLLFFVMNTAMMLVAAITAATAPSGEELRRARIGRLMARRHNLWERAECNALSNAQLFLQIAAVYWRRNLLGRNDLADESVLTGGITEVEPLATPPVFATYPHPAWTIPELKKYLQRRGIEVPLESSANSSATGAAGVS